MEWWRKVVFPVRRVWNGVASRLGIRNSGLLKLRHDVRACEYEDVRVMWDMLNRSEADIPMSKKKRCFWNYFGWARVSDTDVPCI
ncbi:hypothetical protein FNV43_RR11746 [Rhamnella rubrinervis]|uniref:Uncharacterized protein n=1 Tax=Rhamnella rubrinervis TaxID=2594499 RepID=A0A8K0H638_9ROSA|nr:hypothetical protein FNV43_RR11746 [Rhamnella rubrinervis]